MRSGVKPLHSFADTLSLASLGLITSTLSERGRYFGRGPFKTERVLVNYKCNKVSLIYFVTPAALLQLPQKDPPPKTERYSIALPCINTKDI
jgi:hypothetical protein